MQVNHVPRPLQARLGDEATVALVELLDRSHREARDELIVACTERFERRLVEEVAGVRVHIAQLGADLRQEMAGMRGDLRQDMATMGADIRREMVTMGADIRQEMATMGADIRQEMATTGAELRHEMAALGTDVRREVVTMGADVRQEMATGRVDLFKWCFLFWVGQVLAISGIMGVMLRVLR
jgi:hypothetical protein